MSKIKSKEEIIKDIANKINSGRKIELENVTLEDIKALKEFDYIVTPGEYFNITIRRKFEINTVLGIPTLFWSNINGEDGYEVSDECMGAIPETLTPEQAYSEMLGYKGIFEDEI